MVDKDAELLFEYLRSILFDQKIKNLEVSSLDAEDRDLGEGLQYLAGCVQRMNAYASALSRGNLSATFPKENNELCMNLKNLHANLNHLTWQAQQVAEGDYSQRVSYLGEFSIAFNKMTEQLKERETLLTVQAENEKKRAEMFKGYNELLISLTQHRHEWIIVVSIKDKKVLYCNKSAEGIKITSDHIYDNCDKCSERLDIYDRLIEYSSELNDNDWEIENDKNKTCYRIQSHHIVWEETDSYAHIVEDITKEKLEERFLSDLAYKDLSTGLHNRRYLEDAVIHMLHVKTPFSLVFIDLDGLKYVNDNFGHAEGDAYINLTTSKIMSKLRTEDIFARIGGDEFVALFINCPIAVAERKMKETTIEMNLVSNRLKPYYTGFSYGVIYVDEKNKKNMDELLMDADKLMYKCKMEHKKNYNDGRS